MQTGLGRVEGGKLRLVSIGALVAHSRDAAVTFLGDGEVRVEDNVSFLCGRAMLALLDGPDTRIVRDRWCWDNSTHLNLAGLTVGIHASFLCLKKIVFVVGVLK